MRLLPAALLAAVLLTGFANAGASSLSAAGGHGRADGVPAGHQQ
jgi:hypothetical protein